MSNSRQEAKTRFEKEVVGHEMTAQLAQGLHRHLTFKQPNTYHAHFHITTWPGYLCISGDMGCFVFARLRDMFEFFRGTSINPGYWSEKLQADEKNSGHREFSLDLYHAALKSDFEGWTFDGGYDGDDGEERQRRQEDARKRAWEAIADDFDGILHAESTEHAVRQALGWECPVSKQRFTDFWEHNLEDYTFSFLWCCHAIQWAIARFDEATTAPAQITETPAVPA
jgi:hypothetical protein